MEWLSANWVWVLIAIAFVAMHMFGHGGHGNHAGHGGGGGGHGQDDERTDRGSSTRRDEAHPSGHQH